MEKLWILRQKLRNKIYATRLHKWLYERGLASVRYSNVIKFG